MSINLFKRVIRSSVVTGCLTCFLMFSTCTVGAETGQTPTGDDPIRDLNSAFRKFYAQARQKTLDRSGPIVLVRGDGLFLLHKGKKSQGTTVSRAYHDYKTVSHVPLAIYVVLTQVSGMLWISIGTPTTKTLPSFSRFMAGDSKTAVKVIATRICSSSTWPRAASSFRQTTSL